MNWIEIVSLMASFASLTAFSLFLYFSLTLRRQKKELARTIVSLGGKGGWAIKTAPGHSYRHR